MKVLLTGAFGNVGSSALEELLKDGHEVTCFDLKTKINLKVAQKYGKSIRVIWGDLRHYKEIARAVEDQDIVVHTAFIIPKLSKTGVDCEKEPEFAKAVNVGGTRNLIEAMKAQASPPKIIFTSTLHVYGDTQHQSFPRRVTDAVVVTDHYTDHKIQCEEMVKSSGLEWSIFRLAAVLPINIRLDTGMFDVPYKNRMEYVHTRDVGYAIAEAVTNDSIWEKILHIGGGPACQYVYGDMLNRILQGMGVGALPEEAFSEHPFATDWLDTKESQRILNYQRRTIEDYIHDVQKLLGLKIFFIRLFRPFVRRWLLGKSVPYQLIHSKAAKLWRGRTAVITGASSGIGRAIALKFAQNGLKVVLVARREELLESLATQIRIQGGEAFSFPADLTREEDRLRLYDWLRREVGGIDILVNSAGFGWYGYAAEMPWSTAKQMIEINNTALVHLSLLALEEMKNRGRGHIIQVGSVASNIPAQGIAIYSASKAFIDNFTTSLYRELRGTNIHVSVLRPGPVATDFYENACQENLRIPGKRFAVKAELVAERAWLLINRPRRLAYIPRWMAVVPWLEILFGWLIDLLGPALLRSQLRKLRVSRSG